MCVQHFQQSFVGIFWLNQQFQKYFELLHFGSLTTLLVPPNILGTPGPFPMSITVTPWAPEVRLKKNKWKIWIKSTFTYYVSLSLLISQLKFFSFYLCFLFLLFGTHFTNCIHVFFHHQCYYNFLSRFLIFLTIIHTCSISPFPPLSLAALLKFLHLM